VDTILEALKTLAPIFGPLGTVLLIGWAYSESERRRLLKVVLEYVLEADAKRLPLWERSIVGLEKSASAAEAVEDAVKEAVQRRTHEHQMLADKMDRILDRTPRPRS